MMIERANTRRLGLAISTCAVTITAAIMLSSCVKTQSGGRHGAAAGAADTAKEHRLGQSEPADDASRDPEALMRSSEPIVSYKILEGAVTTDQINEWATADRTKRGDDARYYRYAFIPAEFMKDPKEANYARIGLSKAMNSVAIDAADIVSPEDVSEGHGVVYALDLRAYWGARAEQKWTIAARAVTKRVFSPAPRLDLRAFEGNQPVSADRLVYNVLHGGIYDLLIDTPEFGRDLMRTLGAKEVTARTAVKHAITYSPRFIQRRQLPDRPGAYWESFDDFDGNLRELPWITGNPIPRFRNDGMMADFNPVASEAWMHMKNGLPAYYIWGNANQERTKAELSFVLDPLNAKGNELITGVSCIQCHISGVQESPNDMRNAIDQGLVTRDLEKAKEFWTPNEELSRQYAEDRRLVVDALRKIIVGISDGDAKFNEDLINGVDEREPVFFVQSSLTKNPLRGDTTGRRRRDANGKLDALRR